MFINSTEAKAAACHAAWYAYEVLGRKNPGLPYWECSDEQRSLSLDGVKKLDAIFAREDFDSMTLDQIAEQLHINWMSFKVANGWKFGPVRDEEKKEHPCMVEYSVLSEDEKMKDRIFIQAYLSMVFVEYNSQYNLKEKTN